MNSCFRHWSSTSTEDHLQERSGSVALPRVKEVLARAATAGFTAEDARRAARADGTTRRREEDIAVFSAITEV